MVNILTPMAVNMRGAWANIWSTLTSTWPGLTNLMTIVGTIMAVMAFFSWVWQRRRNPSQGNNNVLFGAMLAGALLCAPEIIIPIALWAIDGLINFGLRIATPK